MKELQVRVLYFEGCPNGPAAFELAKSVVEYSGAPAQVQLAEVKNQQEAIALRFLGSPTIQVDGIDVEPERRNDDRYSMSCRVYWWQGKHSGLPHRVLIERVLESAGRRGIEL